MKTPTSNMIMFSLYKEHIPSDKPTKSFYIDCNLPEKWELRLCNTSEFFKMIRKDNVFFNGSVYKNNNLTEKIINWDCSRIILLDFDQDKNNINPNLLTECLQIADDYGLIPNDFYFTRSSTEDAPRFRFVYILDEYIDNYELIKFYYHILKYIFQSKLDDGAGNPTQNMLSGNGEGKVINAYKYFTFDDFCQAMNIKIRENIDMRNPIRNFIQLFKKVNKNSSANIVDMNSKIIDDFYNGTYQSLKLWISAVVPYYIGENTNCGTFGQIHNFSVISPLKSMNDLFADLSQRGCIAAEKAISGSYNLSYDMRGALVGNALKIGYSNTAIYSSLEHLYKIGNLSSKNMPRSAKSLFPYSEKYAPGCVAAGCPFREQCKNSGKTIISLYSELFKNKVFYEKTETTQTNINLGDAEVNFNNTITDIIKNNDITHNALKYPTALGKSETIIKFLCDSSYTDKVITVAVPTHKLKDELMERAKTHNLLNPDTYREWNEKPLIPVVTDKDTHRNIEIARRNGKSGYNELIEYFNKRKQKGGFTNRNREYRIIKEYIEKYTAFQINGKNKLTTHHDIFINKNNDYDVLIIDEDPINVLFPKSEIKLKTIKDLYYEFEGTEGYENIVQFLDYIINSKNEYTNIDNTIKPKLKPWLTFIEYARTNGFINTEDVLYGLFYADFIKVTDDVVIYGKRNKLQKNKTVIILSAGINEDLMKFINPSINFVECHTINLNQKITLHPEHTMSISSIDHQTGDRLSTKEHEKYDMEEDIENYKQSKRKAFYEKFQIELNNKNINCVITHKKYCKEFEKMGFETMYFGGLEGLDGFKNKNVAIIGTPFIPSEHILFLHFCIFNNNPDNIEMDKIQVEANGYKFFIKTFIDEKLQKIHIALINQSMVQAVGRARLLRSDENNIMEIYSTFPVEGCMVENF